MLKSFQCLNYKSKKRCAGIGQHDKLFHLIAGVLAEIAFSIFAVMIFVLYIAS